MEALKSSQADVLVVESECDAVMPHAVIERYLAAMPQARHAVIAGARHELSDPAWAAAFLDHILTWFADL